MTYFDHPSPQSGNIAIKKPGYYIVAVSYSSKPKKIIEVRYFRIDIDGRFDTFSSTHRDQVWQWCRKTSGTHTFVKTSIFKNGKYIKGDEVIEYVSGGDIFITTKGNNTPEDNLGNLPKC